MNSDRKAKVAATATVVGLAALAGAALGSNHGMPAQMASVGPGGRAPIVTGASGSAATTQSAVAGQATGGHRTPIVTRASATAGAPTAVDD